MPKGDGKILSKEVSAKGRLLPSLVLADATTGRWWAFLPPFSMAAQISPAQGEIYRVR